MLAGGSLTAAVAGCFGSEDQPPTFNVTVETTDTVTVGENVSVEWTVTNDGDLEGNQTVVVSVSEEKVASEEIRLANGERDSGEVSVTPGTEGALPVTVATDDDETTATVLVRNPVVESFVAESTGGFLALAADSEAAARENGLGVPPTDDTPDPLVVEADRSADGTWESTAVTIPELDLGDLASGEDSEFDRTVVAEAPEGVGGELDREAGRMTLGGLLRLAVATDDGTVDLAVELQATTDESGALTGSFDPDGESPTVTLVENEAVVDGKTGVDPVDEALGLPAEEPIWLELDLELAVDRE